MPKTPPNSGKPWTPAAEKQLRGLVAQNTPTRIIGHKMGRSPEAVQNKAGDMGVSLKPTNQSPYNRQKKP